MAKRDPAGLIERLPTHKFSADYLVAAGAVLVLLLLLAVLRHVEPVGDVAVRRVVYLATAAAGLTVAFAVATWTNATYSDKSPSVVKLRARQGKTLLGLRYRAQVAALLLVPVGLLAPLIDSKDNSWRELAFYPWLIFVVAAALGLWRALRVSYRVHDLVRGDDENSEKPPSAAGFTWLKTESSATEQPGGRV